MGDVADLSADLQSKELGHRINALLQLLHEICSGQEVGALVTLVCTKVLGSATHSAVKKLAYEVVRTATLTVTDWEGLDEVLKSDVRSRMGEVAMAALQTVPCIPAWKLSELLSGPAELGDALAAALASPEKHCRRLAVQAMAHCLTSPALLETLAGHQGLRSAALTWTEFMGDRLMDPSDTVVTTAHSCLAAVLDAEMPTGEGGAAEARAQLHARVRGLLCTRILRALTPILERTKGQLFPCTMEACKLVTSCTRTLLCASNSQALAYAMEEYGWKGRGYYHEAVVNEVATYLSGFLTMDDPDPTLTLAACASILQLHSVVTREIGTTGWPLSKQMAPAAVKALIKLTAWEGGAEARAAVTELVCGNLTVLTPADQYAAIRAMLPVVLSVKTELDRCGALSLMWTVVADMDMRNRIRQIRGAKGAGVLDLNKVMDDPLVREIVTGVVAGGGEGSSQFAQFPAFREELVGTVAAVTLYHPAANLCRLRSFFPTDDDASSAAPDVDTLMDALFGALSWLGTSRVVLAGSKSCLGWEREGASSGSTTTSAAVDLWLQLLQHSMQVAHEVKAAGRQVTFVSEEDDDPFRKKSADGDTPEKFEDKFIEMVDTYSASFQVLLRQIIVNWRVLSPAVKGRALWVAGHALALPPVMDEHWRALLLALRSALRPDARTEKAKLLGAKAAQEGGMAWREGKGGNDMDSLDKIRPEADNEATEAALCVMEQLVALLVEKRAPPPRGAAGPFREGDALPKGYRELVQGLQELAREYAKENRGNAGGRERCTLLVGALTPLAGLPVDKEAPEVPAEEVAKLPPLNAGWVGGVQGYPLGAATSAALFRTRREVRYRKFQRNLLTTTDAARAARPYPGGAAAGAADGGEGGEGPVRREVTPEAFLEELLAGTGSGEVAGTELTGFADPLQLSAWHELDAGATTLTVHFRLRNRLASPVKGLAVRLAVSGALRAGVRGPFVYQPPPLNGGELATWSMDLSVSSFGRFLLQPTIALGDTAREGGGLRCNAYEVAATQLLLPAPPGVYNGEVLFQNWSSLPFSCDLRAVSSMAGPEAGLYIMSALRAHPHTTCVMAQPVAVEGGFEAAVAGLTAEHELVAMVVSGALTPPDEAGGQGRVAAWIKVRSSSAQAVTALQQGGEHWIRDISGGLLRPAKELSGDQFVAGCEFVPLPDPHAAADAMYNTPATAHALEAAAAAAGFDALSLEDEGGSGSGKKKKKSIGGDLAGGLAVDGDAQSAIYREWVRLKSGKKLNASFIKRVDSGTGLAF